MRKHGWQLPYHPLQVVAIAVFLALGFAFYVFFLPFVGKKVFEYVVMGLYTPLAACVFSLYVWSAATDPGDPGVFKSKKYLGKNIEKPLDERTDSKKSSGRLQTENSTLVHCCFHSNEKSSEEQTSEDGMFYCSLCEVEVLKHSKHCRVCDKCVDGFDHHCRWLNNCIGRRNYGRFFILMIFTLLLLILQWSIGIFVLILCCLEQKRFDAEIRAKLGSSFSLAPFITVLASCTFLAMIATLPLAQLLFFHVLLIKKGISTYDYIVALREQEQEQQGVGQQSPQMSSVSSITGLSSASSFGAFRRDAWCTPPRLFLEDQFDVIPPGLAPPQKLTGKKMIPGESPRKRNTGAVKINPWTLARLNAEQVSNAAEQAKQKSKTLRPVHKTDSSRMKATKSLGPLQIAARSAFKTNRAMLSPDSSLGSPDLHPYRVSSSGPENPRGVTQLSSGDDKGIQFLRSTSSDGYEASGGEDSDRVPAKIVHRSLNWNNIMDVGYGDIADEFKASSSSSLKANGN